MSWMPRASGRWLAVGLGLGMGALTSVMPAWAEEPIDRELDQYWNVEQAVPSVKNPLYEREGGLEASVHIGVLPNDSFYLPVPVGGHLGYFLADTVAVEAGFSYLIQGNSNLQDFLKCAAQTSHGCTDLTAGIVKPPKLNMLGSLDLALSPFHGKVGIFTSKLSSFDLSLALGLGVLNVDIDHSVRGEVAPTQEFKFGGHWGAGFRFYALRWLNFRLDYKQFIYWPDDNFRAPVEFTVGVAILTK